ncbi:hypothetical protein NU195Hw_g5859t1 [Hortaea werneckii]
MQRSLKEERQWGAGERQPFHGIMDRPRKDCHEEATTARAPTEARSMVTSGRGGKKRQHRGQTGSVQAQSGAAPSVEAASTQPERQARGPDAKTIALAVLRERQEQAVDAPRSGEAAPTPPQRHASGAGARTIALATLRERQERERVVDAPQPEAPAWQGQGMQPRQQQEDPNADLDTWDQPAFHDPQGRNARDIALEALNQGTAPGFSAKAIFEHQMRKRQ